MQEQENQFHEFENEPPKKKRRSRVSRACDECRIRKIRCDGNQPCESCDAFDRSCTYRSTQAQKVGGIQHVRALEDSLSRARSYIEELHEQMPAGSKKDLDSIFVSSSKIRSPSDPSRRSASFADGGDQSPPLENMMDGKGLMDLAENKKSGFYGDASGFAFLQKTKQLFDDTQGSDHDSDLSQSTQRAITQLFDSPLPDKQALDVDVPVSRLLPSRQTCSELLHVVFGQVYPLLQFLDEPAFHERTNRIYEVEPMEFEDSDHDFLPLLYSVLALGFLFSQKKHQKYGCGRAVTEGMRHFIAARQMIDVTNCRDLVSLQVLICFILFLMSTARLATSHTFTGLALTSAIRLGLHSLGHHNDSFSKGEQAERRRVFETIVKMDIYTSSVLGLPTLTDLPKLGRTLALDVELDLEHSGQPPGSSLSREMSITAAAKHLEILLIIAKVINTLYPEKAGRPDPNVKKPIVFIRNADITELELSFKDWRKSLPEFLQPDEASTVFESVSYELEMVHNFGHIVLYRPFIHYLAKLRSSERADQHQLRCALACVKIARRTVLKSAAMQDKGFLSPASWYSVYTIFLSIVILVFFLAAQGDARETADVQQAAEEGVRILAGSECQDIGAKRCLDVLQALVKRLSHIVDLNISKIRRETPSLCQSGKRSHPRIMASSDPSKPTDMDRPTKSSPGYDWINTNPQDVPTRNVWQAASSQPYIDQDSISAYLENTASYQLHGQNMPQQGSSHLSPTTSRSSINPYPQTSGAQMGSEPAHFHAMDATYPTSTSDIMEIPYAETFAWPFQTPSDNTPATNGPSAQNFRMYPGQQQLTSEDIAAFMRINPGEHPFM